MKGPPCPHCGTPMQPMVEYTPGKPEKAVWRCCAPYNYATGRFCEGKTLRDNPLSKRKRATIAARLRRLAKEAEQAGDQWLLELPERIKEIANA